MTVQIQRKTASAWFATNTILQLGEPGYDTTTNIMKVGDGTTPWNSLTGFPIQSDWEQASTTAIDYIKNKPFVPTVQQVLNSFAAVATSGSYTDLLNKPTLSAVATSGSYTSLINKPLLASVATSGSYTDLSNKPTQALSALTDVDFLNLSAGQVLKFNGIKWVNGNVTTTGTTSSAVYWNDILSAPTFATVATSGSYNDLTNKPSLTVLNLTSGTISATPSSSTDIANKAYVDSLIGGVNYHEAATYATTTALGLYTYSNGPANDGVGATLTGDVGASLTIDDHLIVAADITNGTRILVKNETGNYINNTAPSAAFNGIYTVTAVNGNAGATTWVLTRATDYDKQGAGVNEINAGDFFYVLSGTANAHTSWVQQTDNVVVGTSNLSFVQFSSPGSFSGNYNDLINKPNLAAVATTGLYSSLSGAPSLSKAATGASAASFPTSGTYSTGDIVWNTTPSLGALGWVKTSSSWKPFGSVGGEVGPHFSTEGLTDVVDSGVWSSGGTFVGSANYVYTKVIAYDQYGNHSAYGNNLFGWYEGYYDNWDGYNYLTTLTVSWPAIPNAVRYRFFYVIDGSSVCKYIETTGTSITITEDSGTVFDTNTIDFSVNTTLASINNNLTVNGTSIFKKTVQIQKDTTIKATTSDSNVGLVLDYSAFPNDVYSDKKTRIYHPWIQNGSYEWVKSLVPQIHPTFYDSYNAVSYSAQVGVAGLDINSGDQNIPTVQLRRSTEHTPNAIPFFFPPNNGNYGDCLTTDGSGNLRWNWQGGSMFYRKATSTTGGSFSATAEVPVLGLGANITSWYTYSGAGYNRLFEIEGEFRYSSSGSSITSHQEQFGLVATITLGSLTTVNVSQMSVIVTRTDVSTNASSTSRAGVLTGFGVQSISPAVTTAQDVVYRYKGHFAVSNTDGFIIITPKFKFSTDPGANMSSRTIGAGSWCKITPIQAVATSTTNASRSSGYTSANLGWV